jgi:hypothetical protein
MPIFRTINKRKYQKIVISFFGRLSLQKEESKKIQNKEKVVYFYDEF